ncbi:MAG: nuclear transport factor 2 family protein [Actinomycetota bacterium]
MATSERIWGRLLGAVERREVPALVACFTEEGSWQNVPHEPWRGRLAIAERLGPILSRSERVQWDVVSASFTEHRAWIERVDRFWIDGAEYAVRCNGVLEADPESGLISEFRDYVDLGEWRARLAAAGPLGDTGVPR